jgi:Uma2 family endonuclease
MSATQPTFPKIPPPKLPVKSLPTMYDLPSEAVGEPGLPDEYHLWQAALCSATFRPPEYSSDKILVACDLNLYYDPQHPLWYKRPDWYAVVGVPNLYQGKDLRRSYVIWQEKVTPIVIVEFLSDSSRDEDLGIEKPSQRRREQPGKWQVYEQILQVPNYIIFDGETNQLRWFELERTSTEEGEIVRYQERSVNQARIWIESLQLGLGLWTGRYRRKQREWLRWYDTEGNWVLTEEELERKQRKQAQAQARKAQALAQRERQEKEQAEARARDAEARAALLAEQLRQLGVNPDELM